MDNIIATTIYPAVFAAGLTKSRVDFSRRFLKRHPEYLSGRLKKPPSLYVLFDLTQSLRDAGLHDLAAITQAEFTAMQEKVKK